MSRQHDSQWLTAASISKSSPKSSKNSKNSITLGGNNPDKKQRFKDSAIIGLLGLLLKNRVQQVTFNEGVHFNRYQAELILLVIATLNTSVTHLTLRCLQNWDIVYKPASQQQGNRFVAPSAKDLQFLLPLVMQTDRLQRLAATVKEEQTFAPDYLAAMAADPSSKFMGDFQVTTYPHERTIFYPELTKKVNQLKKQQENESDEKRNIKKVKNKEFKLSKKDDGNMFEYELFFHDAEAAPKSSDLIPATVRRTSKSRRSKSRSYSKSETPSVKINSIADLNKYANFLEEFDKHEPSTCGIIIKKVNFANKQLLHFFLTSLSNIKLAGVCDFTDVTLTKNDIHCLRRVPSGFQPFLSGIRFRVDTEETRLALEKLVVGDGHSKITYASSSLQKPAFTLTVFVGNAEKPSNALKIEDIYNKIHGKLLAEKKYQKTNTHLMFKKPKIDQPDQTHEDAEVRMIVATKIMQKTQKLVRDYHCK
jgi:hypothetical protein